MGLRTIPYLNRMNVRGGYSISWVWSIYRLEVMKDEFQGRSNVIIDETDGRNYLGVRLTTKVLDAKTSVLPYLACA